MDDSSQIDDDTPTNENDYVKLCSAGDNSEAAIIRSYLEDSGITVYVQGENHRSMLGMVGAFVDLNILVPQFDLSEATRLMVEFHESAEEVDIVDPQGPHRDQFDCDEDELEDAMAALDQASSRRLKGARMAGIIIPLGVAHFSAGAPMRGLLLAGLVLFLWNH